MKEKNIYRESGEEWFREDGWLSLQWARNRGVVGEHFLCFLPYYHLILFCSIFGAIVIDPTTFLQFQ